MHQNIFFSYLEKGYLILKMILCSLAIIFISECFTNDAWAISDYLGRVYFNIDAAETIGQTFHIRGWAYDNTAKGTSLNIHVYCGKGADGASDPHGFSTNSHRPDVNSAFSLTGNHGFDIYYATSETTSHRIMVYTFFTDGTPVLIYDQTLTYRKESKVTFNANGGTGAPSAQTKIYGTVLTLSSTIPTRTGYTFQGWAKSSTGSVAYPAGGSYGVDEAVTLYAVWKANTYTISYNANGGSGAPASQTKTYGKALTLSSQLPSREGYDFRGWAKTSNGTVSYLPGGSYTENSGVTLYAKWELKTFTVTFDANEGTGAPGEQTKTYGTALVLPLSLPERTGYIFNGWISGKGMRFSPGDSYTENEGTVMTADWLLIRYSVSYDANGGSDAPEEQKKLYGTALMLSDIVPVRQDYAFIGWGCQSTQEEPDYLPGGLYNDNAELKLYALWVLERVPGDVNGDGFVDGKDALRLLRYLADLPVSIAERNADVNGDGSVNGKDSLRLLKYFAELDVVLE